MDLSNFRKSYLSEPLVRNDLPQDPLDLFSKWFQQANAASLTEPNAMVLATVSPDGRPSQRIVLLKNFDERGFTFFTNYQSRKASHIAESHTVSLLFPWIILERQIIIGGNASRISREESEKYFASRPRESQIGAWVSNQSEVISSRSILMKDQEALVSKFSNSEVPLPPHWGGFRVAPDQFEFWQGGPARIHDRFLYTRDAETWQIDRLAP